MPELFGPVQAIMWGMDSEGKPHPFHVSSAGVPAVDQGAAQPDIDAFSVDATPDKWVYAASDDITDNSVHTILPGQPDYLIALSDLIIQNSSATVSTWVNVIEETSGDKLATVYCPTLGGGVSHTYGKPPITFVAGKAVQVQCVTTGANVRASLSGYYK